MTKRAFFFIFCLTLIFNQSFAQTLKEQFNALMYKKDTVGQLELLKKWEKSDNNDPELFVSYYNYFVIRSMSEIITVGQDPKGEDVFQIMSQDTTVKEPVAYIYSDTHFEPEFLSKAFDIITKGIEKYPNRLDMRFGKTYIFMQIGDYENLTREIIKVVDYSVLNNNQWFWSDNEKIDEPKEFMLSSIQDYQYQIYNTGNDELLDNTKRISEAVLKYYPDHVESLSNIAVVYLIHNDHDKALEFLLKAEKLNPTDFIVLSNIAHTYKQKGDNANSIKYYELTVKYGDEQAKEYAREQIAKLKMK